MPKQFKSIKAYKKREQFLHIHDIPHIRQDQYRFLQKRMGNVIVIIAADLRQAWSYVAKKHNMSTKEARKAFKLLQISRPMGGIEHRRRVEYL